MFAVVLLLLLLLFIAMMNDTATAAISVVVVVLVSICLGIAIVTVFVVFIHVVSTNDDGQRCAKCEHYSKVMPTSDDVFWAISHQMFLNTSLYW